MCELADKAGVNNVYIHAFTDGRDCDPKSGLKFIKNIEKKITKLSAELISVIGRYYAMDRDQRWERIKLAYDLLVHSKGEKNQNIADAVQNSYDEGITDEFIKPICKVDADGHPIAKLKKMMWLFALTSEQTDVEKLAQYYLKRHARIYDA